MGFDDLANHMAARDGKAKPTGNAEQILSDAAVAQRRMNRTRDLILGTILFVGGGVLVMVYVFHLRSRPIDPVRGGDGDSFYSLGFAVFAGSLILVGVERLYRGVRGRRGDRRA